MKNLEAKITGYMENNKNFGWGWITKMLRAPMFVFWGKAKGNSFFFWPQRQNVLKLTGQFGLFNSALVSLVSLSI